MCGGGGCQASQVSFPRVAIPGEVATWAPTAQKFFLEPGKFATHLISPLLFTFKMLTMTQGMPCHTSSSAGWEAFADSEVHLLEYGTIFHLL